MSMHQDVGIGMTCLPIDDGDPARAVDHHNARVRKYFIFINGVELSVASKIPFYCILFRMAVDLLTYF